VTAPGILCTAPICSAEKRLVTVFSSKTNQKVYIAKGKDDRFRENACDVYIVCNGSDGGRTQRE